METPPPLPELPAAISRRRWWVHLLLIAPYPLVLGILGALRKDAGHHQAALSGGWRGLLMICGSELVFFGLIAGIAWLCSRATKDELLLRWRLGWKAIPLGFAYSIAIRIAAGLVVSIGMAIVFSYMIATKQATSDSLEKLAMKNQPDIESLVDVKAMQDDPAYYWLTITVVSFIFAGLREEFWRSASLAGMRNLWPERFGSRRGEVIAMLILAVAFGLGHAPQGLLGVCLTGVLGALLGGIMLYHRSIWPAVLAHGFFDAGTFAIIPYVFKAAQHH